MIRLTRPLPPAEFTDEFRQNGTEDFKKTRKAVWKQPFIYEGLKQMSNSKCAFCECRLQEESKYLEIEHFAHKDGYPDKVLEWDNFLPACRRCNGQKSTHDVLAEPIINPADEDPREHLRFRLYRFEGLTTKGCTTESVLSLNDYQRLMLNRFRVGEAVLQQLDELADKLSRFSPSAGSVRHQNRILSQLINLMNEGQPTEEYSATVATAIVHSERYAFVAQELRKHRLWSDELAALDEGIRSIAYPP